MGKLDTWVVWEVGAWGMRHGELESRYLGSQSCPFLHLPEELEPLDEGPKSSNQDLKETKYVLKKYCRISLEVGSISSAAQPQPFPAASALDRAASRGGLQDPDPGLSFLSLPGSS